ncbi:MULTISPECIES: PrsW family intramembrane metalloprotease [unclassified Bradyrhizobium]|uniref:PrsW family intramembrane metalloprotease n=1 Tax=unclassified Bradyrhizobium TaxID=2631580 RepID=UPI002916D742|nr:MULTISPECIES: PrsW family glutamic-type intramembrane protease [unclassified Bradyrhizobium]
MAYLPSQMNLLEALATVIGTAAIAPALLILWLVVAAGDNSGPPLKIWTAFLLGAASVLLLGIIRTPFQHVGLTLENPWIAQAVRALFGVALPEELAKVAVIAALWSRRRQVGNAMDTVFYGAAVGLGFAAYENLAYLVQHAEMWRSLAVLRSVLTVPFHGALGIIAGAYLAIARTSTALGANRHNREGARLSSWALVLAAPVMLHAAFDYPLLLLQRASTLDTAARLWLGGISVLIGFSSIALAVRLVRRVAHHHTPRTEVARARLSQLRRMWALLLLGGAAGFVGLGFVLTSIRHWLLNPDRNVAAVLVPLGLTAIIIGMALLIVTTTIYVFGRNRIRTTA